MLLGEAAWRRQEYARAQALFEQGVGISAVAGRNILWGCSRLLLARLLFERGEQTQAATHYEAGVASARESRDQRILIRRSTGYPQLTDPGAALCEQELARTSATRRPGDASHLTSPLWSLAPGGRRYAAGCHCLGKGIGLLEHAGSELIGWSKHWRRARCSVIWATRPVCKVT